MLTITVVREVCDDCGEPGASWTIRVRDLEVRGASTDIGLFCRACGEQKAALMREDVPL